MTIPDFQTLMLPVLRSAAEGEVRISEVVEHLADEGPAPTQYGVGAALTGYSPGMTDHAGSASLAASIHSCIAGSARTAST